jgi:hypothetical protein
MNMADFDKDTELSDIELDRLLQHASSPLPRKDFEAGLLAKLAPMAVHNNVVAFPKRKKPSLWLASLPLAASLILGVWLGVNGTAAEFLPFTTESISQNDTALLGAQSNDELDFLTEDNLS